MLNLFRLKTYKQTTYVGCFMASRISIKVEEEVRELAVHCWELGNKQKHVQKPWQLSDLLKYVHFRKILSLLNNDFATTFVSFFILIGTKKRH